MSNVVDAYRNSVSFEVWVQLSNVLQSKQKYLVAIMEKDEKPRRRADALKALDNLRDGLSRWLNDELKKIA